MSWVVVSCSFCFEMSYLKKKHVWFVSAWVMSVWYKMHNSIWDKTPPKLVGNRFILPSHDFSWNCTSSKPLANQTWQGLENEVYTPSFFEQRPMWSGPLSDVMHVLRRFSTILVVQSSSNSIEKHILDIHAVISMKPIIDWMRDFGLGF